MLESTLLHAPLVFEATDRICVFGTRGALWLPLSRALGRAAWKVAVERGGREKSDLLLDRTKE